MARWMAAVASAALVCGCSAGAGGRQTSVRRPSAAAAAATSASPRAHAGALVYDLRMLSATDGWGIIAANGARTGTLARTTDGAQTWYPAAPHGHCGPALQLPAGPSLTDTWTASSPQPGADEHTLVTVCHTTDGGRHWTAVGRFHAIGTPGLVRFVDSRHGWLTTSVTGGMHSLSDVYLFRSGDGGRHWRKVAASVPGLSPGRSSGGLPATCESALRFVDPHTGWYAGACPQGGGLLKEGQTGWALFLALTHDGGKHWQHVQLPHPRFHGHDAACRVGVACSMTLLADHPHVVELFVGGGSAAKPNLLYRSTDDGKTWTVAPLPLLSDQVATFDGTHLLQVSGESRRIYASNDSGRTWHRLPDLPHPAIGSPQPVSPRTAFVRLANSRGLYRTDDNGHTWTHVVALLSPPQRP